MSGEIETTAEDTEESKITARWLREIELAGHHEKDWRKRGLKVIERYRDECNNKESANPKFNILYANTEVLRGVMYQKTPVPDVRRRFLDRDPAAREAAQALQRALSFTLDDYDLDTVMHGVVEDIVLPGRGLAKVRYVPVFGPMIGEDGLPVLDENGKPEKQVISETVESDYVEWDAVRISPAKRWSKVRWIAFRELLTRDELKSQFGQKGAICKLTWTNKDKENDDEMFKRAIVWSIWDKKTKKVHVVSPGLPHERLSIVDDPLSLKDFWPCPRPVYAIKTTNTMVPVPEYTQYQDQAIELDELTGRINVLVDALRRRGIYNATFPEIEKLANAGDNEFIPVENFSELVAGGTMDKQLWEAPIDKIAGVLVNLYKQREDVKQTIYEVTGLADIVRGVSVASETLGAQQMKARYANVRTGPRQKEIQRFVRDLYRLKAEIIAEKFSTQSLAEMSGIQLFKSDQEKQIIAAQVQQSGQKPPPELEERLKKPTWEQVSALLKNDKLRGFRIDIETDSTIEPDSTDEQKNRVELLSAITSFVQGVAPAVQSGALTMELAKELLSFGVRGFKVSPQIEAALDDIGEQPEKKQDPQVEAQNQQKQQASMQVMQAGVDKAQAEAREAIAQAREAEAKALIAEQQANAAMVGGMSL